MILAKNIHKSYGDLKVLKGVDFEASEGEIVSIVGASGAGKTTFLQILGSLERPDEGAITYGDKNVFNLNDKELAIFRNENIGFIFQFHHLLPEFTALENICIPAFIKRSSKAEAQQRAMELLQFMNLADRADHKPSELSGGEQQRVAVARALMNKPRAVLADEPTGNLDSKNAGEMHDLFRDIRDEFKTTFVIITHNRELAQTADRILRMQDGKILPQSV